MIKLSIKWKTKPLKSVEEIFDKKNMENKKIKDIFLSKFHEYAKDEKELKKFLNDKINNSTDVYFGRISIYSHLRDNEIEEIRKKYNLKDLKIDFKIPGIVIVFTNENESLYVFANAVRGREGSLVKFIFDIYNIEYIKQKVNPETYLFSKINYKFKISESENITEELEGKEISNFWNKIVDYKEQYNTLMKDINEKIYLKEWFFWSKILDYYQEATEGTTIFDIDSKTYESGQTITGYIWNDNKFKVLKKATKNFTEKASIMTSLENKLWVELKEIESTTPSKIIDNEYIKPKEEEKKKLEKDIKKYKDKINKNLIKQDKIEKESQKQWDLINITNQKIDEILDEKNLLENNKNNKKELQKLEKEISSLQQQNKESNKKIEILDKEYKDLLKEENNLKILIDENSDVLNELNNEIENKNNLKKEIEENFKNNEIVKMEFNFTSDIKNDSIYIPSIFNSNEENISASNIGARTLSIRINQAKNKIMSASYKNPFLLSSFLYVGKEKINEVIDVDVNKKNLTLNKEQSKAIKKMLNNNSTFFLQGPPGTGKTMTIARFAEIQCNLNKQVLMTSSTHAAITGFIERLEEVSNDNPNVFSVLNIPNSDREETTKWDSNSLYERHVNKLFKQEKEEIKNLDFDKVFLEKVNDYLTEQDFKIIKDRNSNENIYKKLSARQRKKIKDLEFITSYQLKELLEELEKDKLDLESQLKLDKGLNNKILKYNKNGVITKNEQKNNDNKSIRASVLEKLLKYNNNEVPENFKTDFNNKIIENKLINVIAQTNTSKLSLETKINKKHLLIDFDFDTVIIDEVSKSITLEVLRMAMNAKRAIFAGDYRQLPPVNNYDIDDISNILKTIIKAAYNNPENSQLFKLLESDRDTYSSELIKEVFQPIINSLSENNNDYEAKEFNDILFDQAKKISERLKKLYNRALFKISLINAVKENSGKTVDNDKNYQILKESRRFTGSILEVVNTFYDGEEKLTPFNNKDFRNKKNAKNIKFNVFGKEVFGSNIYWIDTSIVSGNNQFKNIVTEKLKVDNDQYYSYNYDSPLKNDFNMIVVKEVLFSLIENGIDPNDIGIIALNSGQKKLLKAEIQKEAKLRKVDFLKITVETIDWFQGREKDIIITDFVWAKHKKDSPKSFRERNHNRMDFISYERVNVGLSRAKKLSINIGAYKTYIKDITGDYIYSNGNEESNYSYMQKMFDKIKKEGEVINNEN